MKPPAFILPLALMLGTYAHAAPGASDALFAGISMNIAKRLDTRTPPSGLTQPTTLSGVPMAIATRHGVSGQTNRTSAPDRALSGIPMVFAKRL
ncbi:hypothetical protein [Methylibium petroleiphilum]|uniref:hypothetical protein n=1 Tax=Methylibium petroleiphilum TaxID=105560 RepID=UPI001ACB2C2F|nr:hypothetical protein [Methylibium petroleiphilum]MBN9206158.1 hypothetical protein [Methylibium petroleiphilum]